MCDDKNTTSNNMIINGRFLEIGDLYKLVVLTSVMGNVLHSTFILKENLVKTPMSILNMGHLVLIPTTEQRVVP